MLSSCAAAVQVNPPGAGFDLLAEPEGPQSLLRLGRRASEPSWHPVDGRGELHRGYYTDRMIQQAVAEKLSPGVHPEIAQKSEFYVERAYELALERVAKETAAAEAEAAVGPRTDAAPGVVRSSAEYRQRLDAAPNSVHSCAEYRQRHGIPDPRPRRALQAEAAASKPVVRLDSKRAEPVRSSAELLARLGGARQ
jgi:hypothetical protein